MPSANQVLICAAGGGKTTRLAAIAFGETPRRSLLVTYTRYGKDELERKLYGLAPAIPESIEVMTWFTFLLREMARPYRPKMHHGRIEGLRFVTRRSALRIPASNVSAHYFEAGRYIYSDKIAKFICECDRQANGSIMARLAARFDNILVDEVQDLAGFDLDVLELMLRAGIKLTLVGDPRQATYKTNQSAKGSQFGKAAIIKKFEQWQRAGLLVISHECETHRCNQQIADLGDSMFPGTPSTVSRNCEVSGHDGIFVVPRGKLQLYIETYSPQILRYDRTFECLGQPAINFGEAKGLTFDRVLIFPHGPAKKWLASGDITHIEKSREKLYVAATRARLSLAFAYDGLAMVPHAQAF